MARDPKYDCLFEPIRIGPKTMKNRFYQVPHCNGAGSERPGAQAAFRGHEGRGRAGAASARNTPRSIPNPTTCTGSRPASGMTAMSSISATWCDEIHRHGALAGIEMWYGGPHAPCMESRAVPRGPSQIASEFEIAHLSARGRRRRHQRPDSDVRRRRDSRRAGGLRHHLRLWRAQLSAAPVPLEVLQQTHRPLRWQLREPGALCWIEGLAGVKQAVGDNCAVATRFAIDTLYGAEGVEVGDDGFKFVELATKEGVVDLWDVNIGDIAEWGEDAGPSRFYKANHQKPWVKEREEHRQRAGARRRPGHQPGRHGADRDLRPGRHHRRRPALDRGPLPAQQDRRGAPRRHPRVHRLQHVHLALGDRRAAAHLHPERDLDGGVPARLAPGESSRRRRTPARCSWWAPGPPAWNAPACSASAATTCICARLTARSAAVCATSSASPASPSGGRVTSYRQIQLDKLKSVEVHTGVGEMSADDVLTYGARPGGGRGRLALGDGWAEQHHPRADPRRRCEPRPGVHARAGHGRQGRGRPGDRAGGRGLLHRREPRRVSRRPGQAGDHHHPARVIGALHPLHPGSPQPASHDAREGHQGAELHLGGVRRYRQPGHRARLSDLRRRATGAPPIRARASCRARPTPISTSSPATRWSWPPRGSPTARSSPS